MKGPVMEQSGNQGDGAAIRLVTLALLADGDFGRVDIGLLERLSAFDLLDVQREEFAAAAQAYCGELRAGAAESDATPCLGVGVQGIRALLAAIRDRRQQREIAGLIFRIVRADALIHTAESLLLWEALDVWKLRLADVVAGAAGKDDRHAELRPPRVFRRRRGQASASSVPLGEPVYA